MPDFGRNRQALYAAVSGQKQPSASAISGMIKHGARLALTGSGHRATSNHPKTNTSESGFADRPEA
jgi:hypothetical protein